MADPHQELLEATIRHLEGLKADGVRFVSVSSEAIRALDAKGLAKPSIRIATRRESSAATHSSAGPAPSSPQMPTAEFSQRIIATTPRLAPEAKAAAMAELRARVLPCRKCEHLAASRKNVVFGVGDIHAAIMFVGEAPGADEDLQGEPFVGKAGQLLTKVIQTMGLSRESVYIANVLKCRPDTPGQTAGNRKPTSEEMKTCLPYLQEQIELIQPKAIVALGGTAMEGLFGKPVFITKVRGRFCDFRGIPVMPTYHPSYLLRNAALAVKRELWEDMLRVMEKLAMPINEKQRGFFLKSGS